LQAELRETRLPIESTGACAQDLAPVVEDLVLQMPLESILAKDVMEFNCAHVS
jgi:hypothetical protein